MSSPEQKARTRVMTTPDPDDIRPDAVADTPAPPADRTRPFRGLLLGLAIGAICWAGLFLLWRRYG